MPLSVDLIRGAVRIDGLIENECFSSWQEFVERLPSLLALELPGGIASVVVQQEQPSEDDRGKLWGRQDANGGYLGLYAFQKGKWRPFYNIPTNQVIWMHGDSNDPPEGFVVIDTGDPTIPAGAVGVIRSQYVAGVGGTNFVYFAVRYVGF